MSDTEHATAYEWQVDGRPDGVLRRRGERIELTPAAAQYHLLSGALKPVRTVRKTASKTPDPATDTDASADGDAAA